MNLQMNVGLAEVYTSPSQRIRVISEGWLAENGYCATCGRSLKCAKVNAKVFDFECIQCKEQFELKSNRAARIDSKINDGAYSSMMGRIVEAKSPHFLFLGYDTKPSVSKVNYA